MGNHHLDKLALLIHIIANTLTGQSFMLIQVNHNHNEVDCSLARSVFTLLNRIQLQKSSGYRYMSNFGLIL